MLLGNRKSQSDEQNWCVVLDTIQSQMGRNQVAHALSETFTLSREEANDVVSNTPIILLDNLSRKIATQVKEYFDHSGANMILTNDLLKKRKYYRTVWPESPNLTFLHEAVAAKPHTSSESVSKHDDSEALAPDEALHEIRSLSEDVVPEVEESTTLDPELPTVVSENNEAHVVEVEDDLSSAEVDEEQEENEKLRLEILDLQKQLRDIEDLKKQTLEGAGVSRDELQKRDQEIEELKTVLASFQEKHDLLRRESDEVKQIFEEKLREAKKAEEEVRKDAFVRSDEVGKLQQEIKNLQAEISEGQVSRDNLEKKYRETQIALEEKANRLSEELLFSQKQGDNFRKDLDDLKAENQKLEAKLVAQKLDLEGWVAKLTAETSKKEALSLQIDDERKSGKALESRVQELEQSQLRLLKDFEDETHRNSVFQEKIEGLEKDILDADENIKNKDGIIHVQQKTLEQKEQEFEALKREVTEARRRIVDQEAFHKRELIELKRSEKELRLKRLVAEQERIEDEVRVREDLIRKILTEQSKIEKEILEDKQWGLATERVDSERKSTGRLRIQKSEDSFELEPRTTEESSSVDTSEND